MPFCLGPAKAKGHGTMVMPQLLPGIDHGDLLDAILGHAHGRYLR